MSVTQERVIPVSVSGPEMVTLAEDAADRLRGLGLAETPVRTSQHLGTEEVSVRIKAETEQPTGAFKIRGASNAVSFCSSQGVELVAAGSTGNHAKGVSWAAQALGVEADIFMPRRTDDSLVRGVERYGARVLLQGDCIDSTLRLVQEHADKNNAENIHPYKHPLVRAGQATIGLELVNQAPDMTHLILPVGGGGLLTGVATVVKECLEDVTVVAAQVEGCDAFVQSLERGRPLSLPQVDTRFGGVAVANTDPETFELAARVTDEGLIVTREEVYRAVYDHSREHGSLLELAGAVGPAGARRLARRPDMVGAKVVTLATGSSTVPALQKFVDARARRLGWAND